MRRFNPYPPLRCLSDPGLRACCLQDAVSSESGMEDGDDLEESDGSDVDNDGNYYAGNAHKRAHLVRSCISVGSEQMHAAARDGLGCAPFGGTGMAAGAVRVTGLWCLFMQ